MTVAGHSLALGSVGKGVLHLAQISQNEIEYSRSYDLGDTWVQQTFLSPLDGQQSLDPIMGATAGDTTVAVAWRDPKYGCIGLAGCSVLGRIGYAGTNGTSWNPEQVLTDIPAGYQPSVAVHMNRIAVGWPMDQEISPHAEVRVSRNSSWCSVFDPTTGMQIRAVFEVSVALSSKAVHVVWGASQPSSPSSYRVFYRRGRFIPTDAEEEPSRLPPYPRLEQNYPNPFNPTTTIRFTIQIPGFTVLKVYDMLGREVATLLKQRMEAGEHIVQWNAESLPSGVYLYRLMGGSRVETRKAILIR